MSFWCFSHDDCDTSCQLDLSGITDATLIPNAAGTLASLRICGFPAAFCNCPQKHEADPLSCQNFFALNSCSVSGTGVITPASATSSTITLSFTATSIAGSCLVIPFTTTAPALTCSSVGTATIALQLSVTCPSVGHHSSSSSSAPQPVSGIVTGIPLSCNGSTLGALLSNLNTGDAFTTFTNPASFAAVSFGTATSTTTGEYTTLPLINWNGTTFNPPATGKYHVDASVSVSLTALVAVAIPAGAVPSVSLVMAAGTSSPGATALMSGSQSLPFITVAGVPTTITALTGQEFTLNIQNDVQLQQGTPYGFWIEGLNFGAIVLAASITAAPGGDISRVSISFLGP